MQSQSARNSHIQSSVESETSIDPDGLIVDVMNSMEQGVVVWDAEGLCELHNARVFEVLELNYDDLYVGLSRLDFLQMGVNRGEFTQEIANQATERFKERKPFSFNRTMPSGREINTAARPRNCGGFVVTFSDITLLKEKELELGKAKLRAEQAESELSKQLEGLTVEKAALEEQQFLLTRLSMVATHAKDMVAITSASGSIEWTNDAFSRALCYSLDDISGQSLVETLCQDATDPASQQAISDGILNKTVVRTELSCTGATGQSFWMELEVTPVISETGGHNNFIAVGRDTTTRKNAELSAEKAGQFERRKREEANFLADFNGWLQSSESLDELFPIVSAFLCKLFPTSAGSVYVYANSRDVLEGVCNWNDGKLLATFDPSDCWGLRRGRNYFYGDNVVDFQCRHVLESHEDSSPERHYCLPIVAHGDTVGLLCIELPHTDDADSTAEMQKLASFCSEQISLAIANVQLREQLLDQSTRDSLTSLYNRRYFTDFARRELNLCKDNTKASIISLDVDNFKKFNDNFGHDAGDIVLRELSQVLLTSFRTTDIPCRYGGEEFAVFLPGASAEIAYERAEELRQAVNNIVVRYSNESLKITISAGVATSPENGTTVQTLIKSADKALYAAKATGRNNVQHIDHLNCDETD